MSKIVADNIVNAEGVLSDAYALMEKAARIEDALNMKAVPQGVPLRKVITDKAKVFKDEYVKAFANTFEHLSVFIENGTGNQSAVRRLHEAVYNFKYVNEQLCKLNFVLKDTKLMNKLHTYMGTAVGDMAAFILMQYRLYQDNQGISKAVDAYAYRIGVSVDVFTGWLFQRLEQHGGWMVYEEPSPLYVTAMQECGPLMEDCQRNGWQLTADLLDDILSERKSVEEVRRHLLETMSEVVPLDRDISLVALAGNMNLFGDKK